MALFRVDFCGRGELADRQQKLAQMLSRLQKLSEGELQLYINISQVSFTMIFLPNLHTSDYFFPANSIMDPPQDLCDDTNIVLYIVILA